MAIINRVSEFHEDMTAWRRSLHMHPEICYEEVWTSDFIADRLTEFGIETVRGLAGTGVVGILKGKKQIQAAPLVCVPIWTVCQCRNQMSLIINQQLKAGCMPAGMTGI